jgi:hypothetical protein
MPPHGHSWDGSTPLPFCFFFRWKFSKIWPVKFIKAWLMLFRSEQTFRSFWSTMLAPGSSVFLATLWITVAVASAQDPSIVTNTIAAVSNFQAGSPDFPDWEQDQTGVHFHPREYTYSHVRMETDLHPCPPSA